MRQIGCIPTRKFTADVSMTRDVIRAIKEMKTSVLIFPEASYTFDGTATPLPRKLGGLLKKLDVPVMTIITDGAFLRQPLYNDLRLRKVKTSARYKCVLTREEIAEKSVQELDEILDKEFSFDNFRSQWEKKVVIDEPHRAEGLHRVLYQCPACKKEGEMISEGTFLTCGCCGKKYEMDVYGRLHAVDGETEFPHIPDWFAWQRENVKREIERNEYALDLDVDVAIMNDFKQLYLVGEGKLIHNENGFVLYRENGEKVYEQSPLASYSLYSDYNWYELGDVICIGNNHHLYYCFPKEKNVVTKARFAAEELYKMLKK
jgi:transcription elongation factor Elf1